MCGGIVLIVVDGDFFDVDVGGLLTVIPLFVPLVVVLNVFLKARGILLVMLVLIY